MIDLHLVSWNRPDMTKLVIETIRRNTKRDHFRLAVLDNGSNDITRRMLTDLYDQGYIAAYHQLEENMGLEFAREYLRQKDSYNDYFVDIDNDCLPQPIQRGTKLDWLDVLEDLMERYEDYAAISCRTNVMIGTGNIFEDETKEITPFPHPGGSLRIMRRSAVERVGGWSREAPGRGAEERFICGKLNDAGYMTGFATHVKTLHLFGNRARTKERWGYTEGMEPKETGHSDIWHPALENGDDYDEVVKYSGDELAKGYFS